MFLKNQQSYLKRLNHQYQNSKQESRYKAIQKMQQLQHTICYQKGILKKVFQSKADICNSQFDTKLLKKQPIKPRVTRHKSFNVMAFYGETDTENIKHQLKNEKNSKTNINKLNIEKKRQSKQKIEGFHRRAKSLTKSHNYDEQRAKTNSKKNQIIHQIYLPKKIGAQRLLLNKSNEKSKQYYKLIKSSQQDQFKKLHIDSRQSQQKNHRLKTQGNQNVKDSQINSNVKPYQTSYSIENIITVAIKEFLSPLVYKKIKEKQFMKKQKKTIDIRNKKNSQILEFFWKKKSVQTQGLTRKTNKTKI